MRYTHAIKKLFFSIVLIAIALSCSEDNLNVQQNVFVVNGTTFSADAFYIGKGPDTTDGAGAPGSQFSLVFTTPGVTYDQASQDYIGTGLFVYLNIAAGVSSTPKAGNYTYQSEEILFPALTAGGLVALDTPDGVSGTITTGTVTISKSGNSYTIRFNLTISSEAGDQTITGYYKG